MLKNKGIWNMCLGLLRIGDKESDLASLSLYSFNPFYFCHLCLLWMMFGCGQFPLLYVCLLLSLLLSDQIFDHGCFGDKG